MARRLVIAMVVVGLGVGVSACGIPTNKTPQIIPSPPTHQTHQSGSALSVLRMDRRSLR